MTKHDLVKEITSKTGGEQSEVLRIVESFMDTVKLSMVKGKNVYLRSFGTFQVKKRAKITARNISKKLTMIIPEHYAPVFKSAKEFANPIKAKKV
jgi:DNA-binding protein HU-beta